MNTQATNLDFAGGANAYRNGRAFPLHSASDAPSKNWVAIDKDLGTPNLGDLVIRKPLIAHGQDDIQKGNLE
ncbi:MAG: hypothetical protein WA802_10100 [Terracidiphilus sp.]|jgi:hypothetical protein